MKNKVDRIAALDKEKLRASFKKHTSEPDISIDEYVRQQSIELGRNVTRHKLLYLDMRYWIILRDVLLRRRNDASSARLLDYLRLHTRKHKIICPISESIFLELLKQQDLQTRRKTAELIDELSLGVTLAPGEERVGTELAHFFYYYIERDSIYPLKWLIWSKLSYVFGVMYPTNTPFSPDLERVMQKVHFDQMWDRSLTELVIILEDAQPPELYNEAFALGMNKSIAEHADEFQNFNQVYESEIIGVLSSCMPVAVKIIENIFERGTGVKPRISDAQRKEHEQKLFSFFVQAFRKKTEIIKLLPTLYIHALCHASIRLNKNRKLKRNDFYDFHHAVAAVPYCDVFLTERSLRALLNQEPLEINQDFGCKIISAVSEAVEFLEKE